MHDAPLYQTKHLNASRAPGLGDRISFLRRVRTLPQHGEKDEIILRNDGTLHWWNDATKAWVQLTGISANHQLLSTTHTDTFATDVEADLDVLTWIAAATRWEARPASDHGTHGGGGVTDATYLTLSLHASLSAERVLTAGPGIQLPDTGANGTVTVSAHARMWWIDGAMGV